MLKICKGIDLIANLAIILVAILLGIVLVKNYVSPNSPKGNLRINVGEGTSHARARPGIKLDLADVNWAKNKKTLLLVLSSSCHYCSESAPFYKRLAQQRIGRDIQLVAVLPQATSEGQKYLSKLGVSVDEIRQLPLDAIGVRGTPTLILVNNEGVVTESWEGELPADKELEVMRQL